MALLIASFVGWILFTLVVISHDKSLNSRVAILWMNPRGAPLGIVVPAKNRWMENSFIAEASHDKLTKIAVLILDDHYESGDYSLRSESGVVGDEISRNVLCSVQAQARGKRVSLDPVVQRLIVSRCGNGG